MSDTNLGAAKKSGPDAATVAHVDALLSKQAVAKPDSFEIPDEGKLTAAQVEASVRRLARTKNLSRIQIKVGLEAVVERAKDKIGIRDVTAVFSEERESLAKAKSQQFIKDMADNTVTKPTSGGATRLDIGPDEEIFDAINRSYALCLHGSSLRVVKEMGVDQPPKLLTVSDFKTLLKPFKRYELTKSGGTKPVAIADDWLESPQCRYYSDIVFEPGAPAAGAYNLWKGWPTQGKPGDWSNLKGHIRDVICNGNEAHFAWLMDWLAQIIQQPGAKLGTAVAVRGKKGTGKSKVFEWVAKLMGRYAIKVSDPHHITGQFNSHQREALLLIAEEGFWAGDGRAESKLKDMITSPRLLIESKGVDAIEVANYLRLVVISNENWVVPASDDERRFFVLDCSDAKCGEFAYFAAIDKQMEDGGLEAMMLELSTREFDPVKLRKPPVTDALRDQIAVGLSPGEKWVIGVVEEGKIPQFSESLGTFDPLDWPDDKPFELTDEERRRFYAAYAQHVSRFGPSGKHAANAMTFGKLMTRMVPGLENKRSGGERSYVLPACSTVYEALKSRYGAAVFEAEEVMTE